MQVPLPSAAIGRSDTASTGSRASGDPQSRIAQLEAKSAKIREQIKALTDKKDESAATDPQSAKAQQEQIKILQQQLELIMAEIARLQAEAAKKDESANKRQEAPAAANPDNLPMNSTFSITV